MRTQRIAQGKILDAGVETADLGSRLHHLEKIEKQRGSLLLSLTDYNAYTEVCSMGALLKAEAETEQSSSVHCKVV